MARASNMNTICIHALGKLKHLYIMNIKYFNMDRNYYIKPIAERTYEKIPHFEITLPNRRLVSLCPPYVKKDVKQNISITI